MNKRICGWICLLACLVYVAEVTALPVLAAEPKTAERSRVGGSGEAVPQATDSGGGSAWAWVAGIGAAVLAVVGGFLLAGDAEDEKGAAKDAAKDAEASADAAAAAAAAAPPAAAEPTYVPFISGTFTATAQATYKGGPAFTPSITFSADSDAHPGGISAYVLSDGSGNGGNGKVQAAGSKTVMILLDDGFYVGVATIVSEVQIRLANGYVLQAQGSAFARLIKQE